MPEEGMEKVWRRRKALEARMGCDTVSLGFVPKPAYIALVV
jgi:hypothetical protein